MQIWSFFLPRRGLSLRVDGVIALVVLFAAALWGFAFWKHFTARGQPFYYQLYFEPSVMVACGKGFVVARPQVPEMVSFLRRQQDAFSCDAIPANAPLTTDEVFQQGPWLYLMLAVGWTWRIVGVAWSRLGPLFAILFAGTIGAAYLIFRLGVGPILAGIGAMGLATSRLHLKFLAELRDYAKAPFMLVLVLLLGLLVLGRVSWKRMLIIGALYGVVLGVGYGFRSDFLAYIPPFFVALLFVPGGILRNVPMKAAAGVACLAAFLVAAWPVLSTLSASKPGCQWHVVLLGFAPEFYRPLGVVPAPYEAARGYSDEWEYTTTTSYAARVHPGTGHIEYCEVPYGVATREYLFEIVRRFPADVIVRAYAATLRIVELPFLPIEGRDDLTGRPLNWNRSHHLGLVIVGAATLLIAVADLRLALFVVFFLLYFTGMPAVQFNERHYFHFEFLTWFAALLMVQLAIERKRGGLAEGDARTLRPKAVRATVALTACVAALVLVLWAARAYQQPRVAAMMAAFAAAPKESVGAPRENLAGNAVRTAPHTDPETADFIVVEIDTAKCRPRTTVTFAYSPPRGPYGRTFVIDSESRASGLMQIFSPVYDGFDRLAFGAALPGCVNGVYRVHDPGRFSMLPEIVLPPDWRTVPMYQRLAND